MGSWAELYHTQKHSGLRAEFRGKSTTSQAPKSGDDLVRNTNFVYQPEITCTFTGWSCRNATNGGIFIWTMIRSVRVTVQGAAEREQIFTSLLPSTLKRKFGLHVTTRES